MVGDLEMDAVFQALAHESRRRMLDIVKGNPGIGVGALASDFDVSRIAVMKHLAVLETANLIVSEKDGRTRRLYFNAVPIQMIHNRWTDDLTAWFSDEVSRIKTLAERRAGSARKDNKRRKWQ